MFCPKCGAEYIAGVFVCEDCDVPLVEDLPEDAQSSDQDLVLVRNCFGLMEAEELARALDGEGIPSFLNNENMGSLFPGAMGGVSAGGLGRVGIMVPGPLAERAKLVIERVLRDLIGSDGGSEDV